MLRRPPSDASSELDSNAAALERSRATLDLLDLLARASGGELAFERTAQRLCHALAEATGWEHVAVLALDEKLGALRWEAVAGEPARVQRGSSRPLSAHGVIDRAARTLRLVRVDRLDDEEARVAGLSHAAAAACVPLDPTLVGSQFLAVESRRPEAFADHEECLRRVAVFFSSSLAPARTYDAIRRRAQTLNLLTEVTRRALEGEGLPEILERIVHFLQEAFDLPIVQIVLLDEQPTALCRLAAAATRLRSPVGIGATWRVGEAGIVGRALRTREAQFVDDVTNDPDYVLLHEEVRCELVLPILSRGRLLGALNLESEELEMLSAENRDVLGTIAEQVAGVIALAATNLELRQLADELRASQKALRQANARLRELSRTDALTGLANRRHFESMLEAECKRAGRAGTPLSLVLLDLDGFKHINDRYGHQVGDTCLARVADVIRGVVERAGDVPSRWGGEEFAILLPQTSARDARRLAHLIREAIQELALPLAYAADAKLTASFGVATADPDDPIDAGALVQSADRRLYLAKRLGRNRVVSGQDEITDAQEAGGP